MIFGYAQDRVILIYGKYAFAGSVKVVEIVKADEAVILGNNHRK